MLLYSGGSIMFGSWQNE